LVKQSAKEPFQDGGVHPDDRAATRAGIEQALDPGGTGADHAAHRVVSRADGGERQAAASGIPILLFRP
jgi:hypothetical protein